jgi:hypothetical protein
MAYSIFYSWQSDSPRETNRDFIRAAIDIATGLLSADATVVDSPRVEAGMEGVSGTPEVATILFERIKKSAIFIADMTLVGTVGQNQKKKVPNSNVLLEMGYAAGTIGWSRVICVMNEHFGKREKLPFDVRNRRFPIDYSLNPDKMEGIEEKLRNLATVFRGAIHTVEANEYEAVQTTVARLDFNCLAVMRANSDADYFPIPGSRIIKLGGIPDGATYSSAVSRLMDLGLLEIRVVRSTPTRGAAGYAYHWTYLGMKALTELKLRHMLQAKPVEPTAPA